MARKSYHFDIGNSTDGPIGMCGRVDADSKEEAVLRFRKLLDEHAFDFTVKVFESPTEYINVYVNGDAVTEADIDMIDQEETTGGKG